MKNSFLICAFLFVSKLFGQTTLKLVADYDAAIGYHDNYGTANNNYAHAVQNAVYAIPGSSGGLNVNRCLIHFDLSSIPENSIIASAKMNLYALGAIGVLPGHVGSNNQAYVQRVTQSWLENTVTWANQPTATNQNQVLLSGTTSTNLNYLNIDVSHLVNDMLTNDNYGFLLKLVSESATNALLFASIDCGDSLKFPTLEVTYTIPNKDSIVYANNKMVVQNKEFEFPISTEGYVASNSVIAYQFNLEYDASMLTYVGVDLNGTLSQNGNAIVNSSNPGVLNIAWANQTALANDGELLKLKFKALKNGITTPEIKDFLFNTDTILSVKNGTIYCGTLGDVDDNKYVQSYDAALALQASVGLNTLTQNEYTYFRTNVDGIDSISAYDASLILQYAVGLINKFPVEDLLKNSGIQNADVAAYFKDGNLVFSSKGDLKSLNVFIENNQAQFGTPAYALTNVLKAENINSEKYAIAFCSAESIAEGAEFLSIPVNELTGEEVEISLIVNSTPKTIKVSLVNGIDELAANNTISVYPNPSEGLFNLDLSKLKTQAVSYSISNLLGQELMKSALNGDKNQIIDITSLSSGCYYVTINIENQLPLVEKIIKK